jgi:hypothetical protein
MYPAKPLGVSLVQPNHLRLCPICLFSPTICQSSMSMSALPSRGPDLAEVLLLEQQAEVVQTVVQHVVIDAHAHVQGTQGQKGGLESDWQSLQATVGLPVHNRHLPTRTNSFLLGETGLQG